MTFTYTTPPMLPVHEVRFRSGDTVEKPYSVDDETIGWLLTQSEGNTYLAAAAVCDQIGDRLSSVASGSKTVGPLSLSGRDPAGDSQRWYDRAARLRTGGSGAAIGGAVFTPGRRLFGIGMHDNGPRRTGGYEDGR